MNTRAATRRANRKAGWSACPAGRWVRAPAPARPAEQAPGGRAGAGSRGVREAQECRAWRPRRCCRRGAAAGGAGRALGPGHVGTRRTPGRPAPVCGPQADVSAEPTLTGGQDELVVNSIFYLRLRRRDPPKALPCLTAASLPRTRAVGLCRCSPNTLAKTRPFVSDPAELGLSAAGGESAQIPR